MQCHSAVVQLDVSTRQLRKTSRRRRAAAVMLVSAPLTLAHRRTGNSFSFLPRLIAVKCRRRCRPLTSSCHCFEKLPQCRGPCQWIDLRVCGSPRVFDFSRESGENWCCEINMQLHELSHSAHHGHTPM